MTFCYIFLLNSVQSKKELYMALFVVTVSNYTWLGAESGFVRPEGSTISGAIFKSKNTKLGMKVNMYLE